MTNGHKKRMIGRDEEMDRDVLGIDVGYPLSTVIFIFVILEELRVGDTRLASEEDLDGLSVAEVLNLIRLTIL